MANTGIKQATIAYRVSRPGGEPLDVDGNRISISGKRQAIALLTGRVNPNPAVYEVQSYFNEGSIITGNPTQRYDPVSCPIGFIRIVPESLVLTPANPTQNFVLFSINPWTLITAPNIANITPTSGGRGVYVLTATRNGTYQQLTLAGFAPGAIRKNGTTDNAAPGYKRTSVTALPNIFPVQPGKQHFYTGINGDAAYAGVAFYNSSFVFISYACGNVQTYTREPLTIPPGAAYIGAGALNANPIIEVLNETPTGQGYFVFQDTVTGQTASIYIVNTDNPGLWILDTGNWNNMGFWFNSGIWNF